MGDESVVVRQKSWLVLWITHYITCDYHKSKIVPASIKGGALPVITTNHILSLRLSKVFLMGGTVNFPALHPTLSWKDTVIKKIGPVICTWKLEDTWQWELKWDTYCISCYRNRWIDVWVGIPKGRYIGSWYGMVE